MKKLKNMIILNSNINSLETTSAIDDDISVSAYLAKDNSLIENGDW